MSRSHGKVLMQGSRMGKHGRGLPCVDAWIDGQEDSDGTQARLRKIVEEIVDWYDNLPIECICEMVRDEVEIGIETGAKKRRRDGRL